MIATLKNSPAISPKGRSLVFDTRPDTNDEALIAGLLTEDEYGLRDLPVLTGWIIDVGAHIGIVTLALAVDNPDAKVVAVEAIPENAELVARNIARNDLGFRVFVESAGAGAPGETSVPVIYGYVWVGKEGGDSPVVDAGYVSQCRYIGNIFQYPDDQQEAITEQRPGISLSDILAKYDIDRVSLLKIDCEGCEYRFLTDPAVDRVDRIIGEWHGGGTGPSGLPEIKRLLRKTHTVKPYSDHSLFEAVHR